ncbi:Hypothetical protein CpCap5W_1699 [Corynebacterium pseudotuberculosis]|nr:hypothetical protein [Corynebacterium pseudotuberculosis]ARS61156.1 Hypothetical protein CpATCC19410_1734 [Corynebacterium pseudotuberculosis]AZN20499.1 hypothetical protein CpCap1W_1695 [Corynebacterium pseudotuberculosis]AZN22602.1 Hypothetical protein CpOviAF1_1697 [Corynebacterium pseudotuberculosis]MEB3106407.1 hypothetical protein [Corynebacterium pseudotuberculosis]MEB3151814.1 hypothetical protein [Corynebacterium pseudotuberculosis]
MNIDSNSVYIRPELRRVTTTVKELPATSDLKSILYQIHIPTVL